MTLSLVAALETLRQYKLLREVITPDEWSISPSQLPEAVQEQVFNDFTYDSRQVTPSSLLFCKGHFIPTYIQTATQAGLSFYVSETDFSEYTTATGIIVNDVRKAMSLLAMQFYGYPQNELTTVGITGTKGKTTTAYYLQAMLNASSNGHAALFSSVDNCLDGTTYSESELTTPESLDLFRMMREAVDNGMQYLVMEVSSQAYKMNRVYGLTFDVGVFLNISPDHISPVEHPSFEDYLYCKRQIAYNSHFLVLGVNHSYADLIKEDAQEAGIKISTFALEQPSTSKTVNERSVEADWIVRAHKTGDSSDSYSLDHAGKEVSNFNLAMNGIFNGANAAAAFAVYHKLVGSIKPAIYEALAKVRIAGRMEGFHAPNLAVYVDYAHNYASTAAVLDYLQEAYGAQKPYITLITGSAGGKAIDRRSEIVQAAQTRVHRLILTEEDTESNQEKTSDICQEMLSSVTNPELDASIILDRTQAITDAIKSSINHPDRFDAIAIIGKGEERWIKRNGQHVQYEGDDQIVLRLLKEVKQR